MVAAGFIAPTVCHLLWLEATDPMVKEIRGVLRHQFLPSLP